MSWCAKYFFVFYLFSINVQAATVFRWDGEKYVSLHAEKAKASEILDCRTFVDEKSRDELLPLINALEHKFSLAPSLLDAVVMCESGYRQKAISDKGAIGLGQLMPGTAARYSVDPHKAHENLEGAAKYLAYLQSMFKGIDNVAAAYNAGEHRVKQYKGVPPFEETTLFVNRIKHTLTGLASKDYM